MYGFPCFSPCKSFFNLITIFYFDIFKDSFLRYFSPRPHLREYVHINAVVILLYATLFIQKMWWASVKSVCLYISSCYVFESYASNFLKYIYLYNHLCYRFLFYIIILKNIFELHSWSTCRRHQKRK